MTKPLSMEVTRKVKIMQEPEDEDGCSLAMPGWYWLYDGDNQARGPYRTMDEAISAATRGP